MKRIALYLGLATALATSCSIQEEDFNTPQQDDVIYYASFEQPTVEGTRVYANEDLLLRWTTDDRVSIFGKNTLNQQYKFLGETGDNSGGFSKVDGAEYVTGNPISHTVSVYPYQEGTKISEDEVLTLTLPIEQHFAENTFGLGTNTMVSVSSDNFLQYKNVGGYLMLKLYGEGVSVSSITLKGNNGEKLAGKATITMPLDGVPAVVMADDAATKITLVCDTPVALGATAEESTQFWFVVPTITFSKGFTVSVSGQGGVYEKSTEKAMTIERNNLSKMTPIEVELSQPNNVIFYTSVDGSVITPYNPDVFGASIVSNEYVEGVGTITFDGDVTSIGEFAFHFCDRLTSITIPDSVTSIGDGAFSGCTGLTNFTIPENVSKIEASVFANCTSLTSITIPGSVTSIGESAFLGCTGLTSITIPNSVSSIARGVFSGCLSIERFEGKYASPDGLFLFDAGALIAIAYASIENSIVIPDGVTCVGKGVFMNFTRLTSVVVPDSVTSIEEQAFSGCSGLTDVTLPGGLTSISDGVFTYCSSLTNVTIPDGVTHIGDAAFASCSSLTEIMFPGGLKSIGSYAFTYTSLTVITLPEGLTSIGFGAFDHCSSLTDITIPGSVTSIGVLAFSDCTHLSSITVLSITPPQGGSWMFNFTNNCPIYVPAESVDAYKSAQYWNDYADRIQAIPAPAPEAIDLGLPSGIKWASFNLGASKPEDYGDYFAWGETEPYYSSLDPLTWKEGKEAGYDWASYRWCMGSFNSLTKYCLSSSLGYNGFTDTKTVLDPADDAAHVHLGGNWRMPTEAELIELQTSCSWDWTSVNGINGHLVTGPNGNHIFLPAAGRMVESNLDYLPGSITGVGVIGLYWDSSIIADESDNAGYIRTRSDGITWFGYYRKYGQSIRPVCN